jgi:adenylate cyclase
MPVMNTPTHRRLAAVVSIDVVGYSRLMGRDETGTLAALATHRAELIDPRIKEHGGRIVKTMGDGLLLEFPSLVNAASAALDIQTVMAAHDNDIDEDRRIRLRVGINLGDIIIDADGDIHGDGVNVAARLEALAPEGGIAIAHRAYEDVRDRLDAAFEDTGEHELKNIVRPVRVWRWSPSGTDTPRRTASRDARAPRRTKPSIAVLMVDNMSSNADLDHFCAGLSESLITDLSKSPRLAVTSRNASFALAGDAIDPTEVAAKLGVRFIVEGSVQAMGQRMRANIQLIDGCTGEHIWAERYDFTDDDLFGAQDRVVADAVVEIEATIDLGDMARKRRTIVGSAEAYAIYQRAYGFVTEGNLESVLKSRREWLKLKALPDGKALALGGLASCHIMDIRSGWSPDVDGAIGEGHALLDEAIELLPDFPFLHSLRGGFLMFENRLDEALLATGHGVDLDPTYANTLGYQALALFAAGDMVGAARMFQSFVRSAPNPNHQFLCLHALVLYARGDANAALEALENIKISYQTGFSNLFRAGILTQRGQEQGGRDAMREALKQNGYLNAEVMRLNLRAFQDRVFADAWLDALAMAGLPED